MSGNRRLCTFLLPRTDVCEEKTLYFRGGTLSENALRITAGETVSFNCYFNVFDYAIYAAYTSIQTLYYRLSLQGQGILRLRLIRPAECESGYEDRVLIEEPFSSSVPTEYTLPIFLPLLEGRGTIYLSVIATNDSVFYGGGIDADRDPLRSVKVGIAVTTYKREAFVRRNVARLRAELPEHTFSVFVTDNGGTLSQEDVAGSVLIPNRNLGGSGGFARGISEILKRGDCTHILLCDDDIAFESEIFLRTAALLSYVTDPDRTMIGASMLFSDKQTYQQEIGSLWTGKMQLPIHRGIDLTDPLSLAKNAAHSTPDYSGWWYNCFPVTVAQRYGLPYPFFIKVDDVEYCIRSKCDILLLNGIGVWHDSFNYKLTPALEYYLSRNGLILDALHFPQRGAFFHFGVLLRSVAKQCLLQRYQTADLIFRAFDDFLSGADAFRRIDGETLHRELSSLGERPIPRAALEEIGYDLSSPLRREDRGYIRLSAKQVLTLNGSLLPAKKGSYRVIDITAADPIDFYRVRQVVQYDPISEKGFLTKQKRGVLLRTAFRLLKYFFKLLFRFRKAQRSFADSFSETVSPEAWKERFTEKTE